MNFNTPINTIKPINKINTLSNKIITNSFKTSIPQSHPSETLAPGPISLVAFLRDQEGYSRRQIFTLVQSGQILRNGSPCSSISQLLEPSDRLSIGKKEYVVGTSAPALPFSSPTTPSPNPSSSFVVSSSRAPSPSSAPASLLHTPQTFKLYKPDLHLCSRRSQDGHPTIYDLSALKPYGGRLFTVGRLDLRTEGLILVSSDGPLAAALMHPRQAVPRVYRAALSEPLSDQDIKTLNPGGRGALWLEDGLVTVLSMRRCPVSAPFNPNEPYPVYELTLAEGRNRIVRRIFSALGKHVVKLYRHSYGGISLSPMARPGSMEPLSAAELSALKSFMPQKTSHQSHAPA